MDGVRVGDDRGFQNTLMLARGTWQKLYKPYYRENHKNKTGGAMQNRSMLFGMFFLWTALLWNAQNCPAALIKGTVTDSLNSEAVAAAVVKVKGTTDSALTDTAGRFTLNTTTGIGQAVSITSAKIPSNAIIRAYGANGTLIRTGYARELSALPDGIYLLAYQADGSTCTGKLVKFGTQYQTGPRQAGKAAANVTLVFAKYYYRTMERVTAEGDTSVQVKLTLKKGWELDSTNTGLAGVGIDKNTLPVYTQYIDQYGYLTPPRGTVISGKKIAALVNLKNGNITLDRCLIQPLNSGGVSSLIFTYDVVGSGAPAQYKSYFIDCDIDGSRVTNSLIYADCAIRGGGFDALRCNIYGMGSGIAVFGSGNGLNCLISQNYVHGLRSGMYGTPPQQSHNESATIRGFDGTSCVWRNNRLESLSGSDSGALFIQAWAGHINCATITGNLFWTGGWCVPLEAGANGYENMVMINNRFVLGGYGPSYVSGGPGWAQWTENYYDNPAAADHKGTAIAKP